VSTSRHLFAAETCVRCHAGWRDSLEGPIGCDAGAEGNPSAYVGLALTPPEQQLGYAYEEKVLALLPPGSSLQVAELVRRRTEWERTARELAARELTAAG
jgi:hypothetical protein